MKLVVVIVNYRTPDLTVDCLRSLAPEIASIPGSRAVVVENDSGDRSEELIGSALRREGWGDWASLAPAGRNGGFAAGNNFAIRELLASPDAPEFVHLLNPDTRIVPGALQVLLEFLETHPRAGIAGSRLLGPDGGVQRSAFRFHNLAAEFESTFCLGIVSRILSRYIVAPPPRDHTHATDWASGASLMIRTRVLQEVGQFDERYFLYYEETDFCLQARRAGWSCWHVPQSQVLHIGAQSTGLYDLSKPMPPYWFESRRHYLTKNHGRMYLLVANALWITGFSLWRVRRKLQRKPEKDKPRMLADFMRLSFKAERSRT